MVDLLGLDARSLHMKVFAAGTALAMLGGALATLAFGQMLFSVFHGTKLGGGADGVFITRPAFGAFGWLWEVPRRERAAQLLWINLGVLVATYAALALLMRTLFGRALLGIKANERRMEARGLPTYRYRLAVFVLGGALAGMGPEEGDRIAALLRALAADHAVLLIEHDMDVVFAVADRVTVMVDGRVLDEGTPAEIRASAAVQDAYLGHAA